MSKQGCNQEEMGMLLYGCMKSVSEVGIGCRAGGMRREEDAMTKGLNRLNEGSHRHNQRVYVAGR